MKVLKDTWENPVVKKIKVDSYYMYKLKSGYFISASSKYVEELKKQK